MKITHRVRNRNPVYILPSLLTSFSLYAGFYSIISSLNHNFFHAAVAIIVSGVFDSLDGKIARITNTTSRFGVEYDSLSDLVAFGVAPAVLIYSWSLEPFGRLGWVAGFLYLACGALRLARFNANIEDHDPEFFQGLSIPSAAGTIAASVFFFQYINPPEQLRNWAILMMSLILAFLMVSNFKYFSFKGEVVSKKPFNTLVAVILVMALISVKPQIVLFILAVVYVGSGPVLTSVLAAKHPEDDDEAELGTAGYD